MPVRVSMCWARSSARITCSVKNFEPMVMWGWVVRQPERERRLRRMKRMKREGRWRRIVIQCLTGAVEREEDKEKRGKGRRKGRDNTETQSTQRKRREDAEEGHTFIGESCGTSWRSGDFQAALQSGEEDVG